MGAAPALEEMLGRWFDSIPAEVRAEIRAIYEPMLDLMVRAGLRR